MTSSVQLVCSTLFKKVVTFNFYTKSRNENARMTKCLFFHFLPFHYIFALLPKRLDLIFENLNDHLITHLEDSTVYLNSYTPMQTYNAISLEVLISGVYLMRGNCG